MRGIETSITHRSGLRGERLLEGLHAVGRLGDDLHVRLAVDQQLHAATHDAVVVGDQDPHEAPIVSSIVVPSPGAENTLSRPPTSSARSRMPDTPRLGVRQVPDSMTNFVPRRAVGGTAKPQPSSRTRRTVRPTDESSTRTLLAPACWTTLDRLSCVTR